MFGLNKLILKCVWNRRIVLEINKTRSRVITAALVDRQKDQLGRQRMPNRPVPLAKPGCADEKTLQICCDGAQMGNSCWRNEPLHKNKSYISTLYHIPTVFLNTRKSELQYSQEKIQKLFIQLWGRKSHPK